MLARKAGSHSGVKLINSPGEKTMALSAIRKSLPVLALISAAAVPLGLHPGAVRPLIKAGGALGGGGPGFGGHYRGGGCPPAANAATTGVHGRRDTRITDV